MAFRPVNREEGKVIELPAYNGGSSATYTKGDALVFSSGLISAASSSTATDVMAIADETKTVTVDGTLLRVHLVDPSTLVEADCDAVWSTVDVGTFADLASVSTVNPDASSHDIFKIIKGVGVAETGLKVLGFFTRDVTAS